MLFAKKENFNYKYSIKTWILNFMQKYYQKNSMKRRAFAEKNWELQFDNDP